MGIDVRQYAMENRDVRRASCVGCGMCAHVCPRGVLKLENRPARGPGPSGCGRSTFRPTVLSAGRGEVLGHVLGQDGGVARIPGITSVHA